MTERASILIVTAVIAAAACAPTAPKAPLPATDACVVVDDTARPHITFAVTGGERRFGEYGSMDVLAGQTYETLVRVDCTDRVIAGLARSWSPGDDYWQFQLRRAAFTDGTAVTAQAVADALSLVPMLGGYAVMGEHDLRVMAGAHTDVRVLARRELMVYRAGEPGLPSGTGRYAPVFQPRGRFVQLTARSDSSTVQSTHAARGRAPDTISIRPFGDDLRSAIDEGVDALVTNDAATIAYARARSGYRIAPLTWSSTYVLATPARSDSVGSVPPEVFPDAAVGAVSRPAMPPFWWDGCRPGLDAGDSPAELARRRDAGAAPRDGRILFLRDDAVARAVAERITALARGRAPAWLAERLAWDGAPTAVGVDQAELLTALEGRRPLAVVTSLRRVEHGGCGVPSAQLYTPLLAGWRVTPLIDTRDDLVYRPGVGHVTVDADGTLRFGGR